MLHFFLSFFFFFFFFFLAGGGGGGGGGGMRVHLQSLIKSELKLENKNKKRGYSETGESGKSRGVSK